MHSRATSKLLLFIPMLIAVVFVIRFVHEPDLWWQLRTGEYILAHDQVPTTDVFSFTYDGVPWLNVKWGFEVIQAAIVSLVGPEGLPIPQFLANLLLLFFALGTIKHIDKGNTRTTPATALAMLLFLVGLSYRMNGRPELVSYTFTAFYIYIFSTSTKGNMKWLYALIPIQLLWANMHEAYGVGLVMLFIFLFSNWFDYALQKVKNHAQKKALHKQTLIIASAWLAVAVHPSGLQMLWHPYEIFTQLSSNQFTQEIFSAAHAAYWHMPAFVTHGLALIAAWQIFSVSRLHGKFNLRHLGQHIPLFYVMLFVAFFYLSLKSYRNLPFLLTISLPLVALWFAQHLKRVKSSVQAASVVCLGIGIYVSIVSNWFYATWLPQERYGWGISTAKNPVGAAQFIVQNKLKGNAFTDYLSSAYYLWKLQPEFKTFVDLRDLDIFEAEDIEIALMCCTQPERRTANGQTIWEVVDKRYQFTYVAVLNNPDFLPLHRYLLKGNQFILVYADALTSVFVRNNKENRPLIERYKPIVFQPDAAMPHAILPTIFNPFYTPPQQTQEAFARARKAYLKALELTL